MKKKCITMLMTISILLSLALTASAASQCTENFHVYINGGSVVSSQSAKRALNVGPMWANAKVRSGSTVKWLSSEYVNLRGRTPSGAKATELGTTNEPGETVNLYYLNGYGAQGTYYKLAVQYASSNPYTHLDLTCSWMP